MLFTKILDALIRSGYKITKPRRILSAIFAKNIGKMLSAKDLKEITLKDYNWDMSYDTIYKNLALFTQLQIVQEKKLKNGNMYVLNVLGEDTHQIICISCGMIKEIEDLCTDEALQMRFSEYKIEYHVYEIYGVCPECLNKKG